MDPIVADWISLALRWAHVMVGIMWIGTSFHFIWLDASLRREQDMPAGLAGA
ncbi:MAG: urate hydroxylase PuuD, partial [Burkholderiales bacterium]